MPGKKISLYSLRVVYLMLVLLCLLNVYACFADHIHYPRSITSYENDESLEKPFWQIVVDLDRFSLFAYKDGILVKTYPCSGGKVETPSPTGDFKIICKDAWGEGFGGVWMGLDVPWGTFGIHGTKFPWLIGKEHPSKGCIRMLSEDAKELSETVPLGTPVRIVQKNKPFFTRYLGECGSEIYNAQVALKSLGYYIGEFDGMFGKQLRQAIIKFQKDSGLKETGSLNQKTYDKILEAYM